MGDGGPILFKGQNAIGSLLQWRSDGDGLAIIAGTFTSVFHLNDKNCEMSAIKRTLADLITSPS
jgi:hypothetical protein